MGCALRACCPPNNTNEAVALNDSTNSASTIADSRRVEEFKQKFEEKKSFIKGNGEQSTLEILNEAMGEMGITEEPITDHYRMDKIIGSGKYGVVK